ncbi:YjgN family protein [Pseudoduganella plicata]|uniref:DUF898 domain-containing protein n=1 Tax=Pseudoduganella plicata TaxID=321984 RepID=A0A4P7BFX7_9BURK|nr:YjgN family protein [Pseudoduganella plicata]QBQ36887.1 DUF898 domain-containing protein [Pseudoduganella plicata]GGZ07336.1 membrane protein [Pseudoduganella plicata]
MSAVFEQAVPAAATEERLAFSATGSEYFRIWIVNLLLSIVTLGIYSAWAKVRRNQYFYANTKLAGSTFEYHGNPMAILKGRIAALVLLGGYNVALRYSLPLGLVMMVVVAAVMPWLVWKSLQFSLHNSSYRGIRFGFRGSLGSTYLHYLVLPVFSVITLGFGTPFVHQRLKRYQHTESRYGGTHFSFDATVGEFYKTYAVFLGLMIGGGFALGVAGAVMGGVAGLLGGASGASGAVILLVVVGYAFMLCVSWALMAVLQNLIWNHTQLGAHRFKSTMTWSRLAGLYLTNTLGIVFTLGLFIPFAHVRALRYRLESTAVLVNGSLDDVVANKGDAVGAFGEGAADLAGFDLSL